MKEIILAIIALIGCGVVYKIVITIKNKSNKHNCKQINKSSNWFSSNNTIKQKNENTNDK
ncbi:hypothetical protein IB633_08725 [Francisella philomiragia]|uniref:hypothetical protein n=1 Tax=Francisella philomiragia TaxID=28110 RepID=UPI0002E2E35A|nr:hypothetical protein [Francisella philomiragia]AJI47967.1 putative lipoprotein [Francisella philomiragia]AJI48511.1 putative lipoprotein [Francisella philomiragia]MBK2020047.1 hypothetical protein [Francisella philomiragia]MBK2031136.1 hypothetical protein [Francisella philomiragia]MBK2263605.1 hypothetical protein [Francisella philomiragia]